MLDENIVITSNSRDITTRLQEKKRKMHNFRNLKAFMTFLPPASPVGCLERSIPQYSSFEPCL